MLTVLNVCLWLQVNAVCLLAALVLLTALWDTNWIIMNVQM